MYKQANVRGDGNCFYHALHLALADYWYDAVGYDSRGRMVPEGSHVEHFRSFFGSDVLNPHLWNQIEVNENLALYQQDIRVAAGGEWIGSDGEVRSETSVNLEALQAKTPEALLDVLKKDKAWATQIEVGLMQTYLLKMFNVALIVSQDVLPPNESVQHLMNAKFGLFPTDPLTEPTDITKYCFLYREPGHFKAWVPISRKLPARREFIEQHKLYRVLEYDGPDWEEVTYSEGRPPGDGEKFDGVSFGSGVDDEVIAKVVAERAKDGGVVVVPGRFLNNAASKLKDQGWDLSLSGVDLYRVEYAARRHGSGASASGQARRGSREKGERGKAPIRA